MKNTVRGRACFHVQQCNDEWLLLVHASRLAGIHMLEDVGPIRIHKLIIEKGKDYPKDFETVTDDETIYSVDTLKQKIGWHDEYEYFYVKIILTINSEITLTISEEWEFYINSPDLEVLMKYFTLAANYLRLDTGIVSHIMDHQGQYVVIGDNSEMLGVFDDLGDIVKAFPDDMTDF